jgi:CheY-like chemotaxis protein
MEKPKVLIVEDEMDMRIFLSTVFETGGWRPATARNGREGIEKARKSRPDLVLLDVMMPEEGGVAMYRELKTDQDLSTIPVVMLSAVEEETYAHYLRMLKAQSEGTIPEPDAYLEKPPDPEELLSIADRIYRNTEDNR